MYQALYRKYRPLDFDSVVGQDAIIKTLKNSIIQKNFSHAYMFFGSRGTGKTTVSKIFARNINCTDSKDGMACGKCDCCKASFSKDCIDILEIDAASNNGVNDIRELRNKISLVPSQLKYKVYIIDEVHMLSDDAFNALLKTLEEPPDHAVFILATTDPQKVPETVVSRCQCFSFKRISSNTIKDRLEFVCRKEKIKIEDEVLENIALYSEGGLRDALGLLDKLTSYTDSKITMCDFEEVNGIVSNSQIQSFLDKIMCADIPEILSDINDFDNCGKNLIQILNQLLNYTRNSIVDYYLNNKEISVSIDLYQNFINELNEKMFDFKKSGNTRIYFEMFVLKFVNDYILKDNNKNNPNNSNVIVDDNVIFDQNTNVNDNSIAVENNIIDSNIKIDNEIDKKLNVDKKIEEFESSKIDKVIPKIVNIDDITNVRINNAFSLANKNLLKQEISNFEILKDYTFDHEIGYVACLLLDSKIRVVSPDYILISYEYESNVNQVLNELFKFEETYNKLTNSNKKFAVVSDNKWEILRNEYINNLKNKISYELLNEPDPVFEDFDKNDIIASGAVELFGSEIVEVE